MHFYLGVAEWGKEKLIKTTCNHIILTNLHPRTAVCITVQEMQDGGTVSHYYKKSILIKNKLFTFYLKLVASGLHQCCVPCTS